MNIIISKTAYSKGWGSMPYKTVQGLSRDERQALRDGSAIVIMTDCPPSGGGNGTGTTLREVYCGYRDRFYHRVPSDKVLEQITARQVEQYLNQRGENG